MIEELSENLQGLETCFTKYHIECLKRIKLILIMNCKGFKYRDESMKTSDKQRVTVILISFVKNVR